MSDQPAFSSHLRIVMEGADPTGQRAAGIRARVPHAEVVFDPTGELTAALEHRRRPVSRPAEVGGPTDVTDPALAALRQQIVEPVVGSLFTGDEVEAVTLRWGAEPNPDDVWVQLIARDEAFEHLLYRAIDADCPTDPAGLIDPATVAQNLAWQLEDFIAESRFAWGEQRIARYELPPPRAAVLLTADSRTLRNTSPRPELESL